MGTGKVLYAKGYWIPSGRARSCVHFPDLSLPLPELRLLYSLDRRPGVLTAIYKSPAFVPCPPNDALNK